MDLLNLALWIFIPAFIIMMICVLISWPEIYNDDWYFDDEEPELTQKDILINAGFKYSLIAVCISGGIFALDFYLKSLYLFTIFLMLAVIWGYWGFIKN
ncbi:hypothetical protein EC844_10833 [Acinetobacter calcoaceticus]|uniref:Uncharacterized protein n=1 Tax=Acinetobacter calcoaceticus TaxID=471 RepID=A0A4R1XV42_ACICA|nr:hypothetical protein EC844_10833 [Acinetobacter calcoaceticus]